MVRKKNAIPNILNNDDRLTSYIIYMLVSLFFIDCNCFILYNLNIFVDCKECQNGKKE